MLDCVPKWAADAAFLQRIAPQLARLAAAQIDMAYRIMWMTGATKDDIATAVQAGWALDDLRLYCARTGKMPEIDAGNLSPDGETHATG